MRNSLALAKDEASPVVYKRYSNPLCSLIGNVFICGTWK